MSARENWRLDIKAGPDGEEKFAWVFDTNNKMVCVTELHYARQIVNAVNKPAIRDDENHKATVERCIAVAEAEPEMPGSPPETVLKAMIEAGPIENARASCRATKQGIASALRSLIKEDGDAK